jgi:small subunit ribosomal protein S15
MPLTKDEKQAVIKKFMREKGDTGSPEVQVALLSKEIGKLQQHLNEHKHDAPAKVALLTNVAKRRRLLRYLSSRSPDRYKKLIKELKLKK